MIRQWNWRIQLREKILDGADGEQWLGNDSTEAASICAHPRQRAWAGRSPSTEPGSLF
jgi:hypothetical protein